MGKRARHKSICKEIKRLVSLLERSPLVSKLVLGLSENARHAFAPGTAKLQRRAEAGMHLNMYTGNGVMRVFVVCEQKDIDAILAEMKDKEMLAS